MSSEAELEKRLDRLAQYFDLGALANADCSGAAIQRYYRLSRHAYSRYHDKGNAVHMGLSQGDTWQPEDMYGQAAFVQDYLEGAKNVLELATGRGMNSLWLAKRHPDITFCGIDLTPAQLNYARKDSAGVPNFGVRLGDFHDLGAFSDRSQNLVFVVEALCHSDRKDRVLAEVERILRPGGIFIIIDGYQNTIPPSDLVENALRLLARGMAVPDFVTYDKFRETVSDSPLQLVEEFDRSRQIMPSLRRFEALADRFMSPRLKMRIMRALLPNALLHNVVSGYLFPTLMDMGAISYRLTVLRKP